MKKRTKKRGMSDLRRKRNIELLEAMCSVYPGDPFLEIRRDICKLRGIRFNPEDYQVTVEFIS